MKIEKIILISARARLNGVIRDSERLNFVAKELKENFSPKYMQEMKDLIESIAQGVHEYRAYNSIILTE